MPTGPTAETIPAFLSFDVEPDRIQISRGDTKLWPGYDAMVEFSRTLRRDLERVSGARPTFGWYFRTDPQIEAVCGRADAAITDDPGRIASLRDQGDHFGVHSHALRWSDAHGKWVHDYEDGPWLRVCTASSLAAFGDAMGEPARRHRCGAGFLSDDVVDVLEEHGVLVEMGLEPVVGWGLAATQVGVGPDASPIVGRYVDCASAPRTPYRPDPADFRGRGGSKARHLTLVPLSTGPRRMPPRGLGLLARRLLGRISKPRSTRLLLPTSVWPSDRYYWDLVTHALGTMDRPYLSLGVRTDAPDSEPGVLARRRLSLLTRHPLAKRLRFVDPLEVLGQIA